MSGRLGEHRPFPPAVRARLYRQFVVDLERRYPGYRFAVVEADDEEQPGAATMYRSGLAAPGDGEGQADQHDDDDPEDDVGGVDVGHET